MMTFIVQVIGDGSAIEPWLKKRGAVPKEDLVAPNVTSEWYIRFESAVALDKELDSMRNANTKIEVTSYPF